LNNQAQAAEQIQGSNKVDQEIISAANEHSSELDEIIDTDVSSKLSFGLERSKVIRVRDLGHASCLHAAGFFS